MNSRTEYLLEVCKTREVLKMSIKPFQEFFPDNKLEQFVEQMLARTGALYEQHLTHEEIEAYIRFAEDPVIQGVLAKMSSLIEAAQAAGQEVAMAVLEEKPLCR